MKNSVNPHKTKNAPTRSETTLIHEQIRERPHYRDPRPLLRYDGTQRHERISGAYLWPIFMLLVLATFVVGVQVGKHQPTLPNVPVAQVRQ